MSDALAHHVDATLRPDLGRVIARLFLPGEELPNGHSRGGAIVRRVLALDEAEVGALVGQLLKDFEPRHRHYREVLMANASMVRSHVRPSSRLSADRELLLGACFTAEFAVEGAALCNPSAVLHPDQTGLQPGQARLVVSLRAIGEGHLSSIGFATAIVGPGATWLFESRDMPAVAGTSGLASWRRDHLRAVLTDHGHFDELSYGVLAVLPEVFTGPDLQSVLADAHADMLARPGVQATVELLRQLVASAYEVDFPDDVTLSQQVLLPSAAEESNGMEDARFVRFTDEDGRVEYRATYTAYDGRHIAPRLLTSPDLRVFAAHRLAGPAARNKGLALFPRLVGGVHLSLCRSDGESTSLARSVDGFVWGKPEPLHVPSESWEALQVGNCGPPIETDAGWIVLTHGVGAMRVYTISALLLDLEDPSRVIRRLTRPLLSTAADEREGYVPNVVYSCGGLIHDERLWIPYGIGDARIGVAWVDVDELIGAMSPVS
ncbi:MAG: hypothetical protein QOI76_3484 [Frankiales bacterium]|nr:hypothetical protein [Frankiales bacterium]